MADVKFGVGQIKNPTPKFANWIFRVVLYGAFLINFFLPYVDQDIPQALQLIILKWSGLGVIGVHIVSKLFGYDISDIQDRIDLAKEKKI